MENELMIIALSPGALEDGPILVYAYSQQTLQELSSRGIQLVLARCGASLTVIDRKHPGGLPDHTN